MSDSGSHELFVPREGDRFRVYCAGPLFNQSERDEMAAIADRLQRADFDVYLPHRDGMEFRLVLDVLVERDWAPATAAAFLHEAIFALDVYQLVIECDAVAWNLNGRVPDEGAVSEAAIAWSLGKPIVAWSDDVRSLIAGRVNPLLVGLVEFDTLSDADEIPAAIARRIALEGTPPIDEEALPQRVARAVADGRRLWDVMQEMMARENDDRIADVVEELFAPRETVPFPG